MSNLLRRLLRPVPASILAVAVATSAWAASVALITTPVPAADVQGFLNQTIVAANAAFGSNPYCTSTASSNAGTCTGLRGLYTTGSLTTAHSAAATAQVITDTSVTAASVIMCSINAYSGTFGTNGNPTVACVPTANTITATIVNAADTNALSGTVGIGFVVFN